MAAKTKPPPRDESDVRRELLQPVEDVRGVHDRHLPFLALPSQKRHQVRPAQHVEVHGDLVQE